MNTELHRKLAPRAEPKTALRPSITLTGTLLRAYSEPVSLAQAVQVAVSEVDEGELRRVARPDAGLAFQPRTLLAVLAYCYAREIYSSRDIESLLRQDRDFRRLCQEEFPDARRLRRFRRDNTGAVQSCLVSVLRTPGVWTARNQGAREWPDDLVVDEAAKRIEKALFIDAMELELD